MGSARISRSARSFIGAYAPRAFFVVNRGVRGGEDLGATAVRWILPQELPSSLAGLLP